MTKLRNRKFITLMVFILVILHIAWDYFNGGVPVHYVMANDELPGLSNWWGLLIIPLLTWILMSLILKRKDAHAQKEESKTNLGFFISLCFGIVLSLLWIWDLEDFMQYLILLPIVLSLFIRVHRPECLLGFVLGMVYTFGGVLPIVMGLVLFGLSFLTYTVLNRGMLYLLSKYK